MNEKRMPLSQHLAELRSRLILCILATLVTTVVAYMYCPDVFFPILRAPLDALRGRASGNPFALETPIIRLLGEYGLDESQTKLHMLSLTEAFIMRLKVALVVGIILALPVIVHEVWAFVAAGLYEHEKKYARAYAPFSFLLFLGGAALAYFIVLPVGTAFLLWQGKELGLEPVLRLKEYVPFVLWVLLGFGLVFQMPLVILLLTKIGVVGPAALRRARPYAILAIFIVAAVLTPPDAFTQIAMAIPMMGLYELSILLSHAAARKRRSALDSAEQG